MQLQMAIPPAQDSMFDLALTCCAESKAELDKVRAFATEVQDKAILPVIGAGGSYPCDAPLASDLGWELVKAIEGGRINLKQRPSDYNCFRGDRDHEPLRPTDLGRMADLICLEHSVDVVLDGLGFRDEFRWPEGEALSLRYATDPHGCGYRLLARMAQEGFIGEAITFNFDCHFEGALIKEGFQPSGRRRTHGRWPQRFDVVADARSNARLIPQADFVLNKVHGCVATWRRRYAEAGDDRERRAAADASIIVRWTQLLDWRGDLWARDLFRDRVRRHVLVLIGFAGADPVIHSSLRGVLEELRPDFGSQSRVRVIDARPNTLALELLVEAGRAPGGATSVEKLAVGPLGLPELLFVIYVELVRLALEREASAGGRVATSIAEDPCEVLIQLGIVAPVLARWTAALLQSTRAATSGTGEAIDESRDDLYVPLMGDPSRSLLALRAERKLAKLLNVRLTDASPLLPLGFYRRDRDPRAFIATGLQPGELERVAADGSLREVADRLASPRDLVPVVAAADEASLHFFSVPTGERVDL
jgi:SIR2-like domain